jgi:hypothetical protein
VDKRSKALALAKAILTPQNIAIAEEVIQKHFDKAMTEKDRSRLRELSDEPPPACSRRPRQRHEQQLDLNS